jgi:hypothetical protein
MEHDLNDIDRLTIELLGKRNNTPFTTSGAISQDVIDENTQEIINIFYTLLKKNDDPRYADIGLAFNEFLYKTITHINDTNARNNISMDIDSIHEEDTELDITATNRLLYANMGSSDKKVIGVIRKNDFAS